MSTETLSKTPLHALHIELGARMVPFAGYDMPVQYPLGVMKEHLHCREQAGLFDVSHMGQIRLTGAHAAKALETLVPVDIIDLPVGMQRYAMFTNEQGGILDDLMVANLGNDELFLVVNAACKDQDLAHLRQHLGDQCQIEPLFEERALLALQGPAAVTVLARLAPQVAQMTFMQFTRVTLLGIECFVSRSGYTGEDGFEISVPAANAEALARALLAEPEVAAIGLGARDSLRLEAGLCLYGHDMNSDTPRSKPACCGPSPSRAVPMACVPAGSPGPKRSSPSNKTASAANVSACCPRNVPRCVKAQKSSTLPARSSAASAAVVSVLPSAVHWRWVTWTVPTWHSIPRSGRSCVGNRCHCLLAKCHSSHNATIVADRLFP